MKKGFTLIELLAVIVILAIIFIIAVPIVINIINDSKKESLQRSIDLYMNTVQKQITQENMKVKYDPERCDILENGNIKCYVGEEVIKTSTGEDELRIEMNGKKPKSGTIIFKSVSTNSTNSSKITYTEVVLEGMEYTLKEDGTVESKEYVPSMPATGEDYRGYYADVDGDGKVDGVIYADLNKSSSSNASWFGTYFSYVAKTNLNEYAISSKKYMGAFGEKEIIKLKKNNKNSRFYVMALNDFTTIDYTTFYWYYNAYGKVIGSATETSINFGEGYNNTGNIIEIWNKNGTGDGSYLGAIQNNRDIFNHIQTKYQEGWYIPSKQEWTAFGYYFATKDGDKLTVNNYNSVYGLSGYYWTSSQHDRDIAWYIRFDGGSLFGSNLNVSYPVRLGTTF